MTEQQMYGMECDVIYHAILNLGAKTKIQVLRTQSGLNPELFDQAYQYGIKAGLFKEFKSKDLIALMG